MKSYKIYLETTIFNYFFDDDRGILHTSSVKLFNEIKANKFEAYTSAYAIDELLNAPEPKRSKMLALIEDFKITKILATDEADNLAMTYIKEGVLPKNSLLDAQHIACASINNIERIISLNFTHINREKTKGLIPAVNKLQGYNDNVSIYTPMEVVDDEN